MAEAQGDAADLHNDRGVFRAEYERELGHWLRRRLGWLCIAYAVFHIISTSALIVSSVVLRLDESSAETAAEVEAARPPTPLEVRADRAEKRAIAGVPPVPGDARAIEAAKELELRRAEAERRRAERVRSKEAVVSTFDAFTELARELARGVRKGAGGGSAGATDSPPARAADGPSKTNEPGRFTDRWWEDALTSVSTPAVNTQADSPSAGTPSDTTLPSANQTVTIAPSEPSEDQGVIAHAALDSTDWIPWWVWALATLPILGVLAWFGMVVRPRLYTRAELVTAASRMILSLGLLSFAFESALLLANPDASVRPLLTIFFWHLTASLFLPWNWRESLRPIAPLFLCWVLLRAGLAAADGGWISFALSVGAAPLLFFPALVLCYARLRWHRNRFKSGFVGRRFLQMRREFVQAAAVHESLFPKPHDAGWMRFDFGYRPAADIGGDFIHVWTDESDRFHLALIDVTGHGLASAMSVARIHGEIERLRDEYPTEGPAKILLRLNRYFHRLLSRHRLYATAVLMTIDPHSGELRYASAGHPPVFLRSKGRVVELPSTTLLLGAVDDSQFGEEELAMRLEEGDTLVMFTDGAYDARSPRGERFGLERLREIMQRKTAPPRWTQYLMRLVETFEAGMPEDDLLIAQVDFVSRRSISSITGDDAPTTAHTLAGARS